MGDIVSTNIAETSLRFKIQHVGPLTTYLITLIQKADACAADPWPTRLLLSVYCLPCFCRLIGFFVSYIFRFRGGLSPAPRAHCVLNARGGGRAGGVGDVSLGLLFFRGRFLHAALARNSCRAGLQGHCSASGSEGSSEAVLPVLGDLLGALPGAPLPLLGDLFRVPGDFLPLLGDSCPLLVPNRSCSSSLLHFLCLEMFLSGMLRVELLPLGELVGGLDLLRETLWALSLDPLGIVTAA